MFTNVEVYFPLKYVDGLEEGMLLYNYLVGFEIDDIHHGKLGKILDVDPSTINTLFIIERQGAENLLIPAHEEFILGIDQEKRLITVELPEGLLNLENIEDEY